MNYWLDYKIRGGVGMDKIVKRLKAYIDIRLFDPGDSECETVLDHIY